MARKSLYQQAAERKARGRTLAQHGNVLECGYGWSVLSEKEGRVYYCEFIFGQTALYSCTCKDYARNGHLYTCKHGWAVEMFCKAQAARTRAWHTESEVA
jgi:hypothetical protein